MKTTWSDIKRGDVLHPLYSIHYNFEHIEWIDAMHIRGATFGGTEVMYHIFDLQEGMEILLHEMVVL